MTHLFLEKILGLSPCIEQVSILCSFDFPWLWLFPGSIEDDRHFIPRGPFLPHVPFTFFAEEKEVWTEEKIHCPVPLSFFQITFSPFLKREILDFLLTSHESSPSSHSPPLYQALLFLEVLFWPVSSFLRCIFYVLCHLERTEDVLRRLELRIAYSLFSPSQQKRKKYLPYFQNF